MSRHISPRMNKVDAVCRKMAAVIRREFGEIERQQVKPERFHAVVEKTALKTGQTILDELSTAYPEDGFAIDGLPAVQAKAGGYTWVVQPLGARGNFSHGLGDIYSIFVCLKDGEPLEAALYHPLTDELVMTQRGGGSYSSSIRLRVTGRIDLPTSLLCVAPSLEAEETQKILAPAIADALQNGIGCRISNAPALDFIHVAAGRCDGFAGAGLSAAEVLFGDLLIREAGGVATDLKGRPLTAASTTLAAANSKLHGQMLKMMAQSRHK
jgi:myo-inositol-1(or 4)-monophosphatase